MSTLRKLVTMRIDPNVWRKARELGLNISKTCENALKLEIQRAKMNKCRKDWCSGRDLNPGLRLERPEYLAELYYRSPRVSSGLKEISSALSFTLCHV